MRIKLKFIAIIFFCLFLTNKLFASQEFITFKNERGSVLKFRNLKNHELSGSFTTNVATKDCSKVIGKERPVVGYITGNVITVSVAYPSCGSIVNFTGNINKSQDYISTLYIINHQSKDITHNGPGARFIGHDGWRKVFN